MEWQFDTYGVTAKHCTFIRHIPECLYLATCFTCFVCLNLTAAKQTNKKKKTRKAIEGNAEHDCANLAGYPDIFCQTPHAKLIVGKNLIG